MPFPASVLDENEEVVLDLRPHWRRVLLPLVAVPVVVLLASYLWFLVPAGSARQPLRIAILVVALLILVGWSLRRWLRWVTTRYVVTTRRVLMRSGVVGRRGRDVPLTRVNDVSYERTVGERLFRSGTLVIESGGDRGQVVLTDVPRVAAVQRAVYRLVEEEAQRLR